MATTEVSDFDLAVEAILERRSSVVPTSGGVSSLGTLPLNVSTKQLGRRRLALMLWDWDIGKDQFLSLTQR